MKVLLNPKVEYIPQTTMAHHVAKCAGLCYDRSSSKTEEQDEKLLDTLIKSHHWNTLRHWTFYFKITDYSPYLIPSIFKVKDNRYVLSKEINKIQYLVVNGNVYKDLEYDVNILRSNGFEVSSDVIKNECPELFRATFIVTTSRSVSAELNRVSPNNITEFSQRYSKPEGIIKPYWIDDEEVKIWQSINDEDYWSSVNESPFFRFLSSCESSFNTYETLLNVGIKRQEARGVLPMDTITKVAYTYTLKEWKHIIDLRVNGTTGAPHPDAKRTVELIKDSLISMNLL